MSGWAGGILGVLLLPATALAAGGHEAFSWFQLLPLHVPQYVLSAIMIAVLLVAVSVFTFAGKKPADLVIPEPGFTLRNLFELILSFLVNLAEDIIGHKAKQYVPLLATCFIFKPFLGPVWWMAPIMLPIEIVSHLARPLSLSLRLFGNITGDHLVVAIFLGLVPFVVPSIFYGLGLFVSFMQAFIFTVLSMIYISGAVAHEEEH